MDFADAENGNVPKRADVVIGPLQVYFQYNTVKMENQ